MDKLFRDHAINIGIILSKEQVVDPYEKNKEHVLLNPLPIKAIVTDLVFSQIQWKMPGVITDKAKELIIQKKKENLLLQSYRIKIGNEYYYGWKVNGRLQYRVEGNYIRVYVYIKKED